jgi:hypothetical protein
MMPLRQGDLETVALPCLPVTGHEKFADKNNKRFVR